MKLEEKLIVLRKEQRLSQLELAERLNVSRQAVSKWETGAALPSRESLQALSQLYGVPVDDLLGDGERPSRKEKEERPSGPQTGVRTKSRCIKRYAAAAVLLILVVCGCVSMWVFSQGEEVHTLGELKREEVASDSTFSLGW